jgi:hypothetical protein
MQFGRTKNRDFINTTFSVVNTPWFEPKRGSKINPNQKWLGFFVLIK